MRGGWPRNPRRKRLLGEHFLASGEPKRPFPSKQAAERFADETKQDAKAYRCEFCGKFHNATIRRPKPAKGGKP